MSSFFCWNHFKNDREQQEHSNGLLSRLIASEYGIRSICDVNFSSKYRIKLCERSNMFMLFMWCLSKSTSFIALVLRFRALRLTNPWKDFSRKLIQLVVCNTMSVERLYLVRLFQGTCYIFQKNCESCCAYPSAIKLANC